MPDFTILYFTGNSYEWASRSVDISMLLSELNMAVSCTASSITWPSESVGLKQKSKKLPLVSHAQHLISEGTVMDQPWLKSSELFHCHTTEGIWLYHSGRIMCLLCIKICFIWCFFLNPCLTDIYILGHLGLLWYLQKGLVSCTLEPSKSYLQQIWMWEK